MIDARLLLLQQFQERKNKNPAYSMRAFARDLRISAAALSQFLSRKRDLSKTNKANVISRLHFSPLERQVFLENKTASQSINPKALLSEDLFNLIGDWVSFALLGLAKTGNHTADTQEIALKLGIHAVDAEGALERLLRLKLVQVKNQKLKRTHKDLTTTDDVPSQAIRKYHLAILQKAQEALMVVPIDRRDISAMTFPASTKNIAKIKKILRSTQNRIAKLAQTGDSTDVFVISMQYFPLTNINNSSPNGDSL